MSVLKTKINGVWEHVYTLLDLPDSSVPISKITNLQSTLNSKATIADYTVTIGTTWSGSGPYTQDITINGLLATDKPIVDLVPTSAYEDEIAAYGLIYDMQTSANTLTVYATEPTETALNIQLRCIR